MSYGIKQQLILLIIYASDLFTWIKQRHHIELSNKTFVFNGESYQYAVRAYNHTWLNERAVELPVAFNFLDVRVQGRTLEIGNVLGHYRKTNHHVLDKYELFLRRGLKMDLMDFSPEQLYDCIVSISTVEHIGWDEFPRDPEKVKKAFAHIRKLLKPNGEALITFPIGYNPTLDLALQNNELGTVHASFLERISRENEWAVTTQSKALSHQYGKPYQTGNAVAFIYITNDT